MGKRERNSEKESKRARPNWTHLIILRAWGEERLIGPAEAWVDGVEALWDALVFLDEALVVEVPEVGALVRQVQQHVAVRLHIKIQNVFCIYTVCPESSDPTEKNI